MQQSLRAGGIYHICNKSIARFKIFKRSRNAHRFFQLLDYYNNRFVTRSFSNYLIINKTYEVQSLLYKKENRIVKFISFCIMPDHYHLLLKVLNEKLAPLYIANIENSYTRHLNLKIKRKGPLWQSNYRRVLISSNEQLLHVSRYIHLNPTTSDLVKKPEDWKLSSYNEYIKNKNILSHEIKEISIKTMFDYRKFVENNIDYQKTLGNIKKLLLE